MDLINVLNNDPNTIINFIQFKNDEKLEIMKKMHIQKCITWCERNKIQYNNLIEKSNIFLTKSAKINLV